MKKVLSGILASSFILSMLTMSFATDIADTFESIQKNAKADTVESMQEITKTNTQTLSTSQEVDFTVNDAGVITAYSGKGGDVIIPSSIGGRTVYGIGANAFQNKTNVESVTMPSTLERIEAFAFDGCTNIRSVSLNEGLHSIGERAFKNNTNLSDIWIPSTVTEIQYAAFCYTGLTSAYIPATVKNVGTSLFYECTRLKSVIFMADIETLPEATFISCTLLDDVYLGEGIVNIGTSAFQSCTSLKGINLPSTTKTINHSAFKDCSKLEKLDFSNTRLEIVGDYAFHNCVSLTEAIFPYGFHTFTYGENTMERDKGQFIGCTSLVKVVLPSTVTSCYGRYTIPNFSVGAVMNALTNNWELLTHPFTDCNSSLVVYGYPDTVVAKLATYTEEFTFSSLGSVSSENKNPTITPNKAPTLPTKSEFEVVAPEVSYDQNLNASLETDFVLGDGGVITAYSGKGGDVVIPSSIGGRTVYGIAANAFQNKTNVESVTMPSTLERIEAFAFDGCTNIRSVSLNEGLYYIGERAFKNNTNLSDIWIPSTVTEIHYAAFCYTGLTSVYIPATVKNVGTSLFYECTRLKSVIFMADIETLPEATFINCTSLDEVYLREGIVTIGTSAFQSCTNLKGITLPSTTKTINQSAFSGCSKLEKLDFTNTQLGVVGHYAFQYCVSLTEVIFPYGFRTFTYGETSLDTDKGQFKGCSSLVKVVLPSTVDSCYFHYNIGFYSFLNHPFIECNPALVVYGYPDTVVSNLATITNSFSFSSLGSVSSENKNPTITPTTQPQLPAAPTTSTVPTITPEVVVPEVTTPEVAVPEVTTPEVAVPEVTTPEVAVPEVTTPEVTIPSSAYPTWASTFIDFVSPKIMPDISISNYGNASSRGLIAQSLYNMSGDGGTHTSSFTDLGDYGNAIGWCFENGVMAGSSDTWFNAQGNVTREQFALILRQLASVKGLDVTFDVAILSAYPDGRSGNDWAQSGLAWAVKNGLMSGDTNGNLDPIGDVSRTEVAVMLYNFDKL